MSSFRDGRCPRDSNFRPTLVSSASLRHHVGMRYWAVLALGWLLLSSNVAAQDWKHVHKTDEAKWAKQTGLDPSVIHKLWRAASGGTDESADESRIANLDLQGLAERHHVLLVTYAGENNCLTITVFNQLSESKFEKLWSVQQPPDGTGFCDTAFGSAAADATGGAIGVRVPRSLSDGSVHYMVYTYLWNGVTYRFAGQSEMQDK